MAPKQPQSSEDLAQHLQDLVNALQLSSDAYDRGSTGEAKRLALTIRVLVHDTGGQSKSLLGQLGVKDDLLFFATADSHTPGNLMSESPLVMMHLGGGNQTSYVPALDKLPFPMERLPFEDWWERRAARDKVGRFLTRRTLILAMANTDGGGHVDPELDATYANLSRNNSMGWKLKTEDGSLAPKHGPHFATARQVAHELLMTIRRGLGVVPSFPLSGSGISELK